MPTINYATREVEFKVVYYGPPHAGKTTNLKHIHQRLSNGTEAIRKLDTGMDRTLFFSFSPRRATVLDGFRARFELYTVPGTVVLNVPRQLVLRDVDGIVFVADSQWERMDENLSSLENLHENLGRHGHQLEDLPMVLQFNKRDLQNTARIDYMKFLLDRLPHPSPAFEAVAIRGENVFECLEALTTDLLRDFQRDRPQERIGQALRLGD